MTEATKQILSAIFELGLPLILGILAIVLPSFRKKAVVILGSLTPLLLAYAAIIFRHFLGRDVGAAYAFDGMWVITLPHYLACLAVGVVLSLMPAPRTLAFRFIGGLLVPAIAGLGWAIWVLNQQ